MTPSDRYTLIYADETTGVAFTLRRTPHAPITVNGNVTGPDATELITAIAVDLGVLEMERQR